MIQELYLAPLSDLSPLRLCGMLRISIGVQMPGSQLWGVTSGHRNFKKMRKMKTVKRPELDAQASVSDHPPLIRKLSARFVVEGRGGGWDGAGMD